MALPAPNLDDRSFQDLVDDAKRLVQRRCPGWTDHNVADPGVTLIETFAFMTDQLLYRLNRLPDRLYVKYLDLIGLRMLPPTPARAPVTFWLSTPGKVPMSITTGTAAATLRTETEDSIVFSTVDELEIVPCVLESVRTGAIDAEDQEEQEERVDRTNQVAAGVSFPAFSERPKVGDALWLGLSQPAPRCAVRVDFQGTIDGVGVNPKHPPLVWEAWTGESWTECEITGDETGGLNKSGSITVHVPAGHAASAIDQVRAGWLRARVTKPNEGQPPYSAPPVVHGLTACTVGGTVEAINAEVIDNEVIGTSEGVAGQTMRLLSSPALVGLGDPVVEVSSDEGWEEWQPVEHFAESGPDDRHFILDSFTGEVVFGPAVRLPDGEVRNHGAVPPKGAVVRIRRYVIGGGMRGNVGVGAIRTLKSSIPFVSAVENLQSARRGTDGETLEEAKDRGRLLLHTRSRAVTAEDYEMLAREAAPSAARVRCVTAGEGGVDAGSVRVLVVPSVAVTHGKIAFEALVPSEAMLAGLADSLDKVRLIGTRVSVEPPTYRGVTVVARLVARPRVKASKVEDDAREALFKLLNPLPGGGPDGKGWPFGRTVLSGDIYAVLQRVQGVEMVEDARLYPANPVTGERGSERNRIELEPNSLVFSYDHQIRVEVNQ